MAYLKNVIANRIGFRRSADLKRLLVKNLPQFIIRLLNKSAINFVPKEIYNANVLFIHVPKNAGTSISRALYGKSIGHQTASFIKKCDPNLFAKNTTVCIVRNPIERLYSSYAFLRAKGTSDVSVERSELYTGEKFTDFHSFVFKWLIPNFHNIYEFDYVLWPQYWFIYDDRVKEPLVENIFALEKMDKLEEFLFEKNAISTKIGSLNVNGERKSEVLNNLKRDKALCEAIEKLYALDFKIYNEALARE